MSKKFQITRHSNLCHCVYGLTASSQQNQYGSEMCKVNVEWKMRHEGSPEARELDRKRAPCKVKKPPRNLLAVLSRKTKAGMQSSFSFRSVCELNTPEWVSGSPSASSSDSATEGSNLTIKHARWTNNTNRLSKKAAIFQMNVSVEMHCITSGNFYIEKNIAIKTLKRML
ncbi:hypothetical protein CEXT_459721 [Caerostris extrusa]|uniref:Uncharacterized protein n=1 Tax=Caerostris extrusa TaxID=172846 RepID=A0AAV4QXV7_CAEEX|nr:hypothetical protein CEXT_459721 [Caerostris extrusa]